MIAENIYGHGKRLKWIINHLRKSDRILEVGCGTGFMITLPLAALGFSVTGIDTDKQSIEYGKKLFLERQLSESYINNLDIAALPDSYDVIIASEVIEHISDVDMTGFIDDIKERLTEDGIFLVTVPNGYGCFEIEKFLWTRMKLGQLITWSRADAIIRRLKSKIFGVDSQEQLPPSTLSCSPHVQRFTYNSIKKILERNGFEIIDNTGSVLCAGPISNLLFTGFSPVQVCNLFLGEMAPPIASGFFIAARLPSKSC